MQVKKWILSVVSVVATGASWASVPDNLGERLAQNYVQPAMAEFGDSASALRHALHAWCASHGKADMQPVQSAFTRTVKAWGGIEFLRFGPLTQKNRFEKLAFWPDPRGVVQRQVRTLLASKDPAALADGALASRSVAMQGLPALEYVLYDSPGLLKTGASTVFDSYACDYAVAVASNVSSIAGDLKQEWSANSAFGNEFIHPSPANPLYRSQEEVAAEAVKALSTGLEFARNVKLWPSLADSAQKSRPRQAAWWRSDLALPTLIANVQGMKAFYEAGDYLYPASEAWIGSSFVGELNSAATTLTALKGTWGELVANETDWGRLALVSLVLKNAKDLVDQHVAPALGVTIGFNALDGD